MSGRAELYNVFVDWKGRLGREMPGILASLQRIGARRVLDVGCGTGKHVEALLLAGLDAYGADKNADMLEKAREVVGPERLFTWRLGEPAPALGTFDAITCLGNVWPQLLGDDVVSAAARSLRGLLRPGGLLLAGLKAVAIRRETKDPYLPLLKRENDTFFIRFVDFDVPPPLCTFHMVVVRGEDEILRHRAHAWRVWDPGTLQACFLDAGFGRVDVSASLGDPAVAPTTEDVFVHAIRSSKGA